MLFFPRAVFSRAVFFLWHFFSQAVFFLRHVQVVRESYWSAIGVFVSRVFIHSYYSYYWEVESLWDFRFLISCLEVQYLTSLLSGNIFHWTNIPTTFGKVSICRFTSKCKCECHRFLDFMLQGGRSWQPSGEGKNGHKSFRQANGSFLRVIANLQI